jgi:signal transduction histidine kinase
MNRQYVYRIAILSTVILYFSIELFSQNNSNYYIGLSKDSENYNFEQRIEYADKAIQVAILSLNNKEIADANANKGELLIELFKYKEAIPYIEKALALYKLLKDIDKTAQMYFDFGNIYFRLSEFRLAIEYRKKSFEIRKSLTDTNAIISGAQNVAIMHWRLGEFAQAETLYNYSAYLAMIKKDTAMLISAYNSLGTTKYSTGQYERALFYYEKAMLLTNKNYDKVSLIINNIGLIYKDFGEYDKALELFLEARESARKFKYTYGLGYSFNNIGEILSIKNNFGEAIRNFDSALVYYKINELEIGAVFCNRNKGDAYLLKKDYINAEKYYEIAEKYKALYQANYQLAALYNSKARLYFETKNYEKSRKYALQCISIAKKDNYKKFVESSYFILSEIEMYNKQFDLALDYYKTAHRIKDSLFNNVHSQRIALLQTKYEVEKAENENRLLREEQLLKNIELTSSKTKIKNQYIFIAIISFFVLNLAVFLWMLYVRSQKLQQATNLLMAKNAEINKQKEELQLNEENLTEINKLLNNKTYELLETIDELKKVTDFKNKLFSIIGHDLRGPIGTIPALLSILHENKMPEDELSKYLSVIEQSAIASYNLLENLLSWAKNEQGIHSVNPVKLYPADTVLDNFKLLKEIANKKNIIFRHQFESQKFIKADFNMTDAIIRNLISNAIKFSFKNSEIMVRISDNNNFVQIEVIDTGAGMTREEIEKVSDQNQTYTTYGTAGEKGTGLGISMVISFAEQNNGTFGIISDKGKGTTVYVKFPALDIDKDGE